MKTSSFSRVVSGAEPLANAFDGSSARFWWRTILWLHGKPTAPQLSNEARRQIVADGFRFYAQLYRFLAVLFWFVSASVWFGGVFDLARDALYWSGAGILSGLGLWVASGVGFAGARVLGENKTGARILLAAFMVAIIAILSALTVALSIEAQTQDVGNVWLNLGATSAVWAFGVGSYFIEVLYLVAEMRLMSE